MHDNWHINKMLPPGSFSSRDDFIETWLFESPEGISSVALAPSIEAIISDVKNTIQLSSDYKVEQLAHNFYKIEMRQVVYYWYEQSGKMLLGAEFLKKPQGLVVSAIGKFNKGQPPFASDLYNAVLTDRKNIEYGVDAIRIMSDEKMSEEGLGIWEKLLQQGHMIMVYDAQATPGQSQIRITNVPELKAFFRLKDPAFKRYQYVLSEANAYPDVVALFNTRRMREINNML